MKKYPMNIVSVLSIIRQHRINRIYPFHYFILIELIVICSSQLSFCYNFPDYLPLQVGNYWLFDLYTLSSDTIPVDSLKFSIIKDTFINNDQWYMFDKFPFPMCDSLWIRWTSTGDLIYWHDYIDMPLFPFASYVNEKPDFVYVTYKNCYWESPWIRTIHQLIQPDWDFALTLCPSSLDYLCLQEWWYPELIIPECEGKEIAQAYGAVGYCTCTASLYLCHNVGFYFLDLHEKSVTYVLQIQGYLLSARIGDKEFMNTRSAQAMNWKSLKSEDQ